MDYLAGNVQLVIAIFVVKTITKSLVSINKYYDEYYIFTKNILLYCICNFVVLFLVRSVPNEVELEIIRTACSSYSCMAHRCA